MEVKLGDLIWTFFFFSSSYVVLKPSTLSAKKL